MRLWKSAVPTLTTHRVDRGQYCMDLNYTPEQIAFRHEVRQWLQENVPATALKSFDPREGFEQHRQWEHIKKQLQFVCWFHQT